MGSKIRTSAAFKINESNLIHKGKYDYSKIVYKKFDTKVTIVCPIHGDFKQTLYWHAKGQGCPTCSIIMISKINSTSSKEWLLKMQTAYPQMDFSETLYIRSRTKVTVKCPKHGYYTTLPRQLQKGSAGCYKCGRERAAKYSQDHPALWSKSQWENWGKNSKNFDSFKVYILLCENETEVFYKIGRTFTSVKHRYRHPSYMPYNYIILKEIIFENAKEAHEKEIELKNIHKQYKYVPLITFGGRYECFSELLI